MPVGTAAWGSRIGHRGVNRDGDRYTNRYTNKDRFGGFLGCPSLELLRIKGCCVIWEPYDSLSRNRSTSARITLQRLRKISESTEYAR